MSLFAKLAASASVSVAPSPKPSSSTVVVPGKWTASLHRHEGGPFHAMIIGSSPLTSEQLNKGCVCLASVGTSKKFLVYLTQDCVKGPPGPPSISLSLKVCELYHIGKDVREIYLDDLTGDGMQKNLNPHIVSNALTDLVISIKDRYVSKRELWMFQIRLLGSVVYRSLSVPNEAMLRCSSAIVDDISSSGEKDLHAGIVGPQTKIVIRSSSAQICLVVNITKELWEFDPMTCEPLFKKTTQVIINGLTQCITEAKHHYLLLLVSGRLGSNDPRDVYEIVYEGPIQNLNVANFEKDINDFFNYFPTKIGWTDNRFFKAESGVPPDWLGGKACNVTVVRDSAICGCTHEEAPASMDFVPGSCVNTNLLESINLAISHFSKHHMDRKLHVTGTQITVVTANSGILHVNDPRMFEISKRRIQATACGIRVVSVGSRPTIPGYPPICLVGSQVKHKMGWLVFYYFEGNSAVLRRDNYQAVDLIASVLLPTDMQRQSSAFDLNIEQYKSPFLSSDLSVRKKPVPEPYRASGARKPARTDQEIVQLSLTMPRLQRVAFEATIRPGDVKPIDNWIVQGEGVKTLHDLIGTRLSLDMQLVDISGTEPSAGFSTPPQVQQSVSSAGFSPKSEKAPSSSIISANAFGVKVHRAFMRESHIQKVLLRGGEDRCMWMLNRLDSGNVYVSRVAVANQNTADQDDGFAGVVDYRYILRRSETAVISEPVREVIACKFCQEISELGSIECRKFFIPPPIPWNVLDEIISNPYFQKVLPSTVPLNQAPVPQELEGFRWKLRSSIRTGLFCLVPLDYEFSHQLVGPVSGIGLGQEVVLQSSVSGAGVTSRFLDWLRKTESMFQTFSSANRLIDITVLPEKQKRQKQSTGFVPSRISASTNDWFQFHAEPVFQFPRPFIFSIEWILCHSALVEHAITSIEKFAREDNFRLIRLSHSQLFPVPEPFNGQEDPLPFHPRTSVRLPEWTKGSFYSLLLSRLMDQLQFLLLISNREEGCSEGISVGRYFSRQPGWILVNKSGSVLVEIRANSVDWILNNTRPWSVEDSKTDYDFHLFKQVIHTSLIDSQRHSD
jgi:hypothetical protein